MAASTSSVSGMRKRRRGADMQCSICGTSHSKSFWYRHLLSQVHKNAVLQRDMNAVPSTHGVVVHQVPDKTVYDILFAPSINDDVSFTHSELSTVDEAMLEETFLACKNTIESFFAYFYKGIIYRVEEALTLNNSIKIHCSLSLRMQKFTMDNQLFFEDISLKTTAEEIVIGTDINEWFFYLVAKMLIKYEENAHRGSNWTLKQVNDFELHVSKFSPLLASSYIPLPIEIKRKKAVINVKNYDDEQCFKYSILAKILYERKIPHLERVSIYKKDELNELFNFDTITFPTSLSDISKFENYNQVSVNVYGLCKEGKKDIFVYPLEVSKNIVRDRHFNLLYIQQESSLTNFNVPPNGHYCYITNLSRLVSTQNNRHGHGIHICHNCLMSFRSEEKLIEHEQFCNKHDAIRSEMPSCVDNIQKFKNYKFQQRVPYIVYADFECALIPFATATRDSNIEGAFTEKTHLHLPTSYCYYIVNCNEADNRDYRPILYRGPNAVKHFWQSIRIELEKISSIYENIVPLDVGEDDVPLLRTQPACHICGEVILRGENDLPISGDFVVDHCHLTGKVRGWACNDCNLNYKLPNFVPIVLHNGSNYDFKMLIREIFSDNSSTTDANNSDNRRKKRIQNSRMGRGGKQARYDFIQNEESESDEEHEENGDEEEDRQIGDNFNQDNINEDIRESEHGEHDEEVSEQNRRRKYNNSGEIKVIAKNIENFISFDVKITKSLSARFIDSFRFMSSSLSSLANNLNAEQLKHVNRFYQGELFDLAKRKGVFPYEYITDFEQYEELELPPINTFYSSLSGEGISLRDYNHAKSVFEKFNCQNLGEYSDIYLTIDVLLLADVFENFRDLCFEIYNLDAAWHYSAPGLAWNAMLKVTKVELELLTDYTMFLFYEASIRGGYCAASERYVKANNPSLENFNPNETSNYLFYIDANNLYGNAMSEPLPLNGFRWLGQAEIEALDINSISKDSPVGYVLEVDLEYPRELSEEHNDYPFCPEQLKTCGNKGVPSKLIATLHDKKNYIIHYRYLQTALQQGLVLKKIHRGVRFNQKLWMQPYINLNNERRKVATTEFAKDYHKLMNNACFGKFLESIRKRRSFILTNKKSTILKNIRKPTFKRRLILNEKTNLIIIERARTNLLFDKFIQAGGAILDLSKDLMYNFHYNIMKSKIFPNKNISLAYTDTDSFIYNIPIEPTSSLTDYLIPYKSYFDFSNYPPNHPLFDNSNKKVLGKMKDEVAGGQMSEFCALKAKMYSYKLSSGEEVKKAKGIAKSVIKKSLHFEQFLDCLTNSNRAYRTVTSIRSFAHQIYTIQQNKVALSMLDDKRHIMPDGIRTLAWGHPDIPRQDDIIYRYNFAPIEVSEDVDEENGDVEGDIQLQ